MSHQCPFCFESKCEPNCARHRQELEDECEEWYRRDRLMAARSAICQRGKNAYCLRSRWSRWFHTLKTLVCLWLELDAVPEHKYRVEHDTIAFWDEQPGGEGGTCWTQVEVGCGFFTGWWYEISRDSSY